MIETISLIRRMRDRRKKMVGKKLRRIKRYLKRLKSENPAVL